MKWSFLHHDLDEDYTPAVLSYIGEITQQL